MGKENIIISRFALYLIANPDATKQEFMADTGGNSKDWDNHRARVRGRTLRDRNIRLPHSKGIIHMMINPETTKAQYVKAGFNADGYAQNCARARELLIACNAAGTYIKRLDEATKRTPEKTVAVKKGAPAKKVALQELSKPEPVAQPKPILKTITEPTNCVDHSDLVLKIQSGVAELINELNEQQAQINTYRSRITALNAENFRLRSEVAELTEMINGPSK